MTALYAPSIMDRLFADPDSPDIAWTLEQLKDAVARDLEMLLNTRVFMDEETLASCPLASASILNYGLKDFAGMSLSSDEDRSKVRAAVKLAIERFEPRLSNINAELRVRSSSINRIDFVISANLKGHVASDVLHFDAVLEPSSQQYSIRRRAAMPGEGAA